jgi:hypothetical protein
MSVNSNTATVETLTAQVRVLVVGKRQVTKSVYQQLDWCSIEGLKPMGRVNVGDTHDIEVVGAELDTGELVRGGMNEPSRVLRAPECFQHYAFHRGIDRIVSPAMGLTCWADMVDPAIGGSYVDWARADSDPSHVPVYESEKACLAQPLRHTDWKAWRRGDACNMDALREKTLYRLALADERFEQGCAQYDALADLPLIVLAGLR